MELITCNEYLPEYSVTPFTLQQGQIMLLFSPVGSDVKFCMQNQESAIIIKKQPYWVNFSMDKLNRESIKIINQHKEYLYPYFSSKFIPNRDLDKKKISLLSGWDIRLINMFLKRKQYNISFFELNIAGLSYNSIKLMFNFIFKEQETHSFKLTYLIIAINKKGINFNPVFVDKSNVNEILHII